MEEAAQLRMQQEPDNTDSVFPLYTNTLPEDRKQRKAAKKTNLLYCKYMRLALADECEQQWEALDQTQRDSFLALSSQQETQTDFLLGPTLKYNLNMDTEISKHFQAFRHHVYPTLFSDISSFSMQVDSCYRCMKSTLSTEILTEIYMYMGSQWGKSGRPYVDPFIKELPAFLKDRKNLKKGFNSFFRKIKKEACRFPSNLARLFSRNPQAAAAEMAKDHSSLEAILAIANFMASFPYVVDSLNFSTHGSKDWQLSFTHTLKKYQSTHNTVQFFIMRHYAWAAAYMKFVQEVAVHVQEAQSKFQ